MKYPFRGDNQEISFVKRVWMEFLSQCSGIDGGDNDSWYNQQSFHSPNK